MMNTVDGLLAEGSRRLSANFENCSSVSPALTSGPGNNFTLDRKLAAGAVCQFAPLRHLQPSGAPAVGQSQLSVSPASFSASSIAAASQDATGGGCGSSHYTHHQPHLHPSHHQQAGAAAYLYFDQSSSSSPPDPRRSLVSVDPHLDAAAAAAAACRYRLQGPPLPLPCGSFFMLSPPSTMLQAAVHSCNNHIPSNAQSRPVDAYAALVNKDQGFSFPVAPPNLLSGNALLSQHRKNDDDDYSPPLHHRMNNVSNSQSRHAEDYPKQLHQKQLYQLQMQQQLQQQGGRVPSIVDSDFSRHANAGTDCSAVHEPSDYTTEQAVDDGEEVSGGSSEADHPTSNGNHAANPEGSSSGSLSTIRVRAVISGWKAGTIIGRQGAVINRLRNESQCKITISDDSQSHDRVLSVSGRHENVANVLRQVCFMIGASASSHQQQQSIPQRRSNYGIDSAADIASHSDDEPSVTPINLTLAVASPLCGCLIGKGGNQIRVFRQTFGVAFSVSSQTILESLDRPVSISGPPANVADCLEEICRLFAKTTAPPAALSAKQPGSPRGHFKSSWKRNFPDHRQQQQEVSESGVPSSTAVDENIENVTRLSRKEDLSNDSSPDFGGGEVLGSSIEECTFELTSGESEVYLLVPNDIVGCIIGKGGKTISEIREASGALITITESAFPPAIPPDARNYSTTASNYGAGAAANTNANAAVNAAANAGSSGSRTNSQRGMRLRNRVICIRGHPKNVATARYLMGSSILNAQRGGGAAHKNNIGGSGGGGGGSVVFLATPSYPSV